MGRGIWCIILGGRVGAELGWLGHYLGWVEVGGDERGWVQCLIMPIINKELKKQTCLNLYKRCIDIN